MGAGSLGYDSNGNLSANGGTNFTYDVENRLVAATGTLTTSMVYDPMGRLYQTSSSAGVRQFLYDGDERIAEYDGSSGALLRRYVHGNGDDDPLLWYEGSTLATLRSLQSDHQGSIVSVADASGGLVAINTYDEYGVPGSGNIGAFQYTGQTYLPDLGMYYYKARIYASRLGRFLQTDPIGYKDQMDLYAYVGNDPVDGRDPSGECAADTPIQCEISGGIPVQFNGQAAQSAGCSSCHTSSGPATRPSLPSLPSSDDIVVTARATGRAVMRAFDKARLEYIRSKASLIGTIIAIDWVKAAIWPSEGGDRQKGDRFRDGDDAQQQYEEIDAAQRKVRQGKSNQIIDSIGKSKQRDRNSLRSLIGTIFGGGDDDDDNAEGVAYE